MGSKRLFISGHLTEEGISLYVDGLKLKRSADLPEEILGHVAECTQCKQRVADLHSLLDEVPYSNAQAHPFFDRPRVTTRFVYRIAAALVVTLGASAIYYYSGSNTGGPVHHSETAHVFVSPGDSSSSPVQHIAPPPDTLYAAEFEPSPNLEDLVGTNIRSSSAEIIHPRIGGIVPVGTIRLQWKGGHNSMFRIVVLNNAEKVIRSVETATRSVALTDSLIPGLYYWKIEQQEDLLGVGKFFVK